MTVIETVEISKIYRSWWRRREVHAVDRLSLAVGANAVFGFLGPNGAGKTTTIKLLLGLLTPSSGGGSLLGAPLGDRRVKERVGFLPDSPNFYPHLTARAFLQYCARLLHLDWATYQPRIDRLLGEMDLSAAANRKLGEFSRGMLQRVGIAQALLNDPDLVILDEPITGLDPFGRNQVKDIIRGLKAQGKTVFFSSHILADVEQMCDEIGILNRGRLVAHGPIGKLLSDKEVTIWTQGLAAAAIDDIESLAGCILKKDGRWGFKTTDPAAVSQIRAAVSSAGGEIVQQEARQESLEDFFMTAIAADNLQTGRLKTEG